MVELERLRLLSDLRFNDILIFFSMSVLLRTKENQYFSEGLNYRKKYVDVPQLSIPPGL